MKTFAVILAGGRGERFWPQSRRSFPKQFLSLFGTESLVQMTSRRIAPICPLARQRFVIDPNLGQVLGKQLPLRPANYVLEPYGRNTAPAIALAAAYVAKEEPDSTLVVLPADHVIRNTARFQADVRLAVEIAQMDYLVTFGIPPGRPDTSYGYIETGAPLAGVRHGKALEVKRFREKPGLAQARRFLEQGGFWWNSGMFVWRTDVFLHAVELYLPEFYAGLMRFQTDIGTRREEQALAKLYAKAESKSVDYAIMERACNVAAVRAGFDWDDVGSWSALERHFPRTAEGNVALGKLAVLDSAECLSLTDEGAIALIGCQGLVVVRSGDAVLVCPKERAGDIKRLLGKLSADRKLKKLL